MPLKMRGGVLLRNETEKLLSDSIRANISNISANVFDSIREFFASITPTSTNTYLSPELTKKLSDIDNTLSLLKAKEDASDQDRERIQILEREFTQLKNTGVARTIVES